MSAIGVRTVYGTAPREEQQFPTTLPFDAELVTCRDGETFRQPVLIIRKSQVRLFMKTVEKTVIPKIPHPVGPGIVFPVPNAAISVRRSDRE